MFYLKHFLQFSRQNILSSLFFILLSILTLWSFGQRTWLKTVFTPQVDLRNNQYFTAILTEKADVTSIKRKMENLPGVAFAKVKTVNNIKKTLESSLEGLNLSEYKNLLDEKYFSLKIFLREGYSGKNLVVEYLKRLAGKSSISVSTVKTLSLPSRIVKGVVRMARNLGDKVVLGIAALIWSLFSVYYLRKLGNYLTVIQFYQRRNKLIQKSCLTLGGGLFLVASSIGFLSGLSSEYFIAVLGLSLMIIMVGFTLQIGEMNAKRI
jgi:hypothetical protein